MAYQSDIDAVGATLELTIDYRSRALACTGRLDAQTRRHVLEAVEELLQQHPRRVTLDVHNLHISDSDGANTLVRVQRLARDTGTSLDWVGLDSDHFHDMVPSLPFPAFDSSGRLDGRLLEGSSHR